MGPAAHAQEDIWTVPCGLPLQDNSILALLPSGGYTGPWPGDPHSGHLEVRTLNRPSPEGDVSTEMWVLSRTVGWWRLKAMRVHPEDESKLSLDVIAEARWGDVRQVIDSPFLSEPVIVRAGDPDEEDLVDGQIMALMPDAPQLRCAPRPGD